MSTVMSTTISLDQIRLASPCPAKWDQMDGDDDTRFCHQCQKNVYDLTRMSHQQFVELVTRTEGKFCGRIYRRADDRVLTDDCPVGVARIRRHMRKILSRCAAAVLFLLGFVGYGVANSLSDPDAPLTVWNNSLIITLEEWANGPRMVLGSMTVAPPTR